MPSPRSIRFPADGVEHDPRVRDREEFVDGIRWALVEYAPGAGREGWCDEPHVGYLVSGELDYIFQDGSDPIHLSAGDAVTLPSAPAHRGHNPGPEPARLFIVDAVVQGRC